MVVSPNDATPSQQLSDWWAGRYGGDRAAPASEQPKVAGEVIHALVEAGLLGLPLPGEGQTWRRLEALARLGELDLTVGRLAEAHCDALAILAELTPGRADLGGVWAVWAAEPPTARVSAERSGDGGWMLSGRKAWCSGAGIADRALVTAHGDDGPRLFAVDLHDPGARPVDDGWPAPALAGTDTRSVDFADLPADPVGGVGDYVDRRGFWLGATGVAAVWYGGAVGVATRLLATGQSRRLGDIDRAHLGAVTAALAGGRGVLAAAATAWDAERAMPLGASEVLARSARAVVEDAATAVIDHVGRALGPAPLALAGPHARRVADLQLYLRQSHAERDLAELGSRVIEAGGFR
jgi:alkylation response protein AidB-like acyl-CoA dehydrogenase